MTTSPAFENLTPSAQRKLLDHELSKGVQFTKQDSPVQMNPADMMTCIVLGISIKTMVHYCDAHIRNDMLDLAAKMSLLMIYAPGERRQEALQAAWQLRGRTQFVQDSARACICSASNEQPTINHRRHRLASDTKYTPPNRPFVTIHYISIHVVPLIDHWPTFVRDAFAAGVWRFALSKGEGGVEGAVLEVREFSLDLLEWFMEMQVKRSRFMGILDRRSGAVGRGCVGDERQEMWVREGPQGLEVRMVGGLLGGLRI